MFWLLAKAKTESAVEEKEEYRYFAASTQEIDGAPAYWGQGMYNLAPAGEALFLEAVATIPEPATIALLGLGAWWLGSASQSAGRLTAETLILSKISG